VDAPVESSTVGELISVGLEEMAQADLNNDGVLDARDVAAFASGVRPVGTSDVVKDGVINVQDLVLVLGSFGTATSEGDTTLDGEVDIDDLLLVLSRFGQTVN